jgi:hypothetical protein
MDEREEVARENEPVREKNHRERSCSREEAHKTLARVKVTFKKFIRVTQSISFH